jgi:hypothetical protein
MGTLDEDQHAWVGSTCVEAEQWRGEPRDDVITQPDSSTGHIELRRHWIHSQTSCFKEKESFPYFFVYKKIWRQ